VLAFLYYDFIILTNLLDFKFDECLILGYSQLHNGYNGLSLNDRVYIFKDVLFNEHRFSYVNPPISIKYLNMYFNLSPTLTPPHSNFFTNYFCYT